LYTKFLRKKLIEIISDDDRDRRKDICGGYGDIIKSRKR